MSSFINCKSIARAVCHAANVCIYQKGGRENGNPVEFTYDADAFGITNIQSRHFIIKKSPRNMQKLLHKIPLNLFNAKII